MSLSVDRKTGPLIHFNKAIEDSYGLRKTGAGAIAEYQTRRGTASGYAACVNPLGIPS